MDREPVGLTPLFLEDQPKRAGGSADLVNMTTPLMNRIHSRYGRLLSALALVAGGIAFGLASAPRGVTATEIEVAETPGIEAEGTVVGTPSMASFQSVMRFGRIYVMFTHHPTQDRSCWGVYDLKGSILGIYADQQAVETFFPEVDTDELMFAAIRNGTRHAAAD
jgi:hypothetical protein